MNALWHSPGVQELNTPFSILTAKQYHLSGVRKEVENLIEIRRNTQKYPSNTQKYAETPYQTPQAKHQNPLVATWVKHDKKFKILTLLLKTQFLSRKGA